MAASIASFWGLSRSLTLLGDPTGLLETTDDLPALAARLRREPVVATRGTTCFMMPARAGGSASATATSWMKFTNQIMPTQTMPAMVTGFISQKS